MIKARLAMAGLLLAALVVTFGCSSSSSSSNGTDLLFVATQGDNMVSAYGVNTSNGIVSSVGNPQATGNTPSSMVILPSQTLLVANKSDSTISAFPFGGDGTLSASSGTTPLDGTPQDMAANAAGTFLFVTIQNAVTDPGSVQVFSISSLALTPVGTFAAGIGASGIAVAPTGNQVYVANSVDGTVSAYAVDVAGNLSLIAPAYLTGGTAPVGVGITPGGNFVYVANSGSNNVSGFTACIAVTSVCPVADGSLVLVTGSPFSTGLAPTVVRAHPTLDVLYVLAPGSNQVAQYSFSSATGFLTALAPPTISTGLTPVSLVVQPAGLQVFTADIGAARISGFNINQTTGALMSNNQTITTSGQPAALATQ